MSDIEDAAQPTRQFTLWEAVLAPSVTNALIAAAIAILAAGGAMAYVLNQAPIYRSAATIQIDQPRAIAASGDVGVIEKLNRLLPKYSALVFTQRIIRPIAERTDIPPGEVAASISAVPFGNSLLMITSGRNHDPERAQVLAQATADQIIAFAAEEQEEDAIPPEQRYFFDEIQSAGPARKISPTRDDAIAAGAIAALVGLAVAYVVIQLVTASRRLNR